MSWGSKHRVKEKARKVIDQHDDVMVESVTTFDKDSDEFKKMCDQCEHISDIKVKHGMNNTFIEAPVDVTCKVKGFTRG